MRLLLHSLLFGTLFLTGARLSFAQTPSTSLPAQDSTVPERPSETVDVSARTEQDLASFVQEIDNLHIQQVALQKAPADDDQQKKIELLQKQIETLEKMVKLLAEQLKKQPAGPAVATLEARSVQAAHRDQELASSIDDLREHVDAEERAGPSLPASLKELFLPSGNNETPLSIYGSLAFGYSKILGDTASAANGAGRPSTPGGFYFGEFTPDFFVKLNDWILLEAEIGVAGDGSVSVGSFAQADFFITDWLTIIGGRFVLPIGWYNDRLNNPWVNKLPADAPGSGPLLWQQVLPAMSGLGVQAQGSFYLGCSPLKMEYNAYITNALNVTPATAGSPTIDELANLENMENTFNLTTNELAFGGRLGLWWPEAGLEVGVSAMNSGDYISGFENSITLGAVDFNYHKGNWDLRAEYGIMHQQTQPFFPTDITRQGVYGQIAYRPRDCEVRYLENFELIYRYGYVNFKGIHPGTLDLTTYATPLDVPVRRQQNEIGIDYYFSPRLVLKCAYQVNDESGFHLHDNQFLTEMAWGW